MLQESRHLPNGEHQLFQKQQHRKQQTPQHKIPAGTVPQARQHPDRENVKHPPHSAHPIAAHGNVHIVPEPGAQAHVPPAPEFGDGSGKVGIVEILDEMESEQPAQADGHIGIAGEIEVDVQHEGHGVHPVKEDALFAGGPENFRQLSQLVCNQNLLGKANEKPPGTVCRILKGCLPALQFPGHIYIPDDGTGNQLGKQRHISTEGNGIFLGRDIPPVHIHRIAHALEGIEADADGQGQAQQRNGKARYCGKALKEEVCVLKNRQQHDADDNGNCQPDFLHCRLSRGFNGQAAAIEGSDGKRHQRQILRLSPAVEKQAGQQKYCIFCLPGHQKINGQHRRKEII